jgi:hypothetical protein
MSHQDWKPIVLKKNDQPKKSPEIKSDKEVVDEIKKLEYFERSFCIKISQLQQDNKMNRKQLAEKLKIKEADLADIQNVNKQVKYDGAFVHKCKRVFGNFEW